MTKCELQVKLLPRQTPFVIGLTGPIASGKSTVATMLRQKGAHVIDADEVYRSLLIPRSNLWHQLVERFGPTIIGSDEEIDRAELGELVFRDRAALADLDRITHPAVVAEIRTRMSLSTNPVLVIEAVKLVQSGLSSDVDALWLVSASPETRLSRLMSRTGMDEEKARARIDAAPSAVQDDALIAVTIDNSGDLAATAHAVDEAWRAMRPAPEKNQRVASELVQKEHS